MLLDFNSINNLFNEYNVEEKDRTKLISIVVARHIAQTLPLPTSPVNSAVVYYQEQVSSQAETLISEFNNGMVIQVNSVMRLVQYLYCLRYSLVYDTINVNARDFVNALFMISTDLPDGLQNCFKSADSNLIESLDYKVSQILNPKG